MRMAPTIGNSPPSRQKRGKGGQPRSIGSILDRMSQPPKKHSPWKLASGREGTHPPLCKNRRNTRSGIRLGFDSASGS